MPRRAASPLISVIIPTRNRAQLLKGSLASLMRQQLRKNEFEVVIVDDGSNDGTAEVCALASKRLNLRYMRIDAAGISAAKNLGIFLSSAPLLLFFDDDDLAQADLLTQHLATHRAYPAEHSRSGLRRERQDDRDASCTTYRRRRLPLLRNAASRTAPRLYLPPLGRTFVCKQSLLTSTGSSTNFASSSRHRKPVRLTRFNLQVIHNRAAVSS